MTASLGGYQYESTTTRALGSITPQSYDYRDQAKTISKLVNDVSFMAGLNRKMQKGIDDANKNFVQQIQGLLQDILVIFAGGGDTGFDFGDLKYILQAIGALFGFQPGMPLPINLFDAAWHFFSQYIFPVENFQEVIDMIIDGAIATVLDLFGEIPVVGQALQQLAVIISRIRDALIPLTNALDKLFGAFNGDWLNGDFGAFEPLWDAVITFFGVISGPVLAALLPILEVIANWSMPFIELLTDLVEGFAYVISILVGSATGLKLPFNLPGTLPPDAVDNPLIRFFVNLLNFFNISNWITTDFNPLQAAIDFASSVLKPTGILAWLGGDGRIPDLLSPKLLYDFLDAIANAFQAIPFVGPFIAKPIFDAIRGLLGIGQGNSTQITAIQNQLNSDPVSGGVSISDTMDYPAATTLPSSVYNVTMIGAGSGTVGPDGNGALVYQNSSGSAIKEVRNRHKTKMKTSYQSISCVILNPFMPKEGAQTKTTVKLQGRMNEIETTWTECNICFDYFQTPFVNLRYVVNGGSPINLGTYTGDWPNDPSTIWECKMGGPSGSRHIRVYRNNVKIVDANFGADTSVVDDVNNLSAAISLLTGQNTVGAQLPTPDIGLFAFSDKTPNS